MPMTAQKNGYFLNWMRNSYAFEEECKFWKRKKMKKEIKEQNEKDKRRLMLPWR